MARKTQTVTDYLTRRGITANVLARELGISPQFLSEVRSGRRTPRLELALRIAKHCGVPVESLVGRASSEPAA